MQWETRAASCLLSGFPAVALCLVLSARTKEKLSFPGLFGSPTLQNLETVKTTVTFWFPSASLTNLLCCVGLKTMSQVASRLVVLLCGSEAETKEEDFLFPVAHLTLHCV